MAYSGHLSPPLKREAKGVDAQTLTLGSVIKTNQPVSFLSFVSKKTGPPRREALGKVHAKTVQLLRSTYFLVVHIGVGHSLPSRSSSLFVYLARGVVLEDRPKASISSISRNVDAP